MHNTTFNQLLTDLDTMLAFAMETEEKAKQGDEAALWLTHWHYRDTWYDCSHLLHDHLVEQVLLAEEESIAAGIEAFAKLVQFDTVNDYHLPPG